MKSQTCILAGLLCGLLGGLPVLARTWQTPVMATWTEDPRTTVTLAWERHEPGDIQIEYAPISAVATQAFGVAFATSERRHVFTLRDLVPGTHYRYTVSSSDGYEADGRFWTAPDDPSQPFSFVLHNDLQGGINPEEAARVSAGIVKVTPDFVLSTGDLADSRYAVDYPAVIESWNLFFRTVADELAMGIFQPVSGNHDEPENPDSFWYRLIELPGNKQDYTLDVGPIRFILLDSTESQSAGHVAWLTRELQRAAFDPAVTWVIPAFHRPPYSEGERGGDEEIRQRWAPLFTQYEADLVLSGHAHTYQRFKPLAGVSYLVSGGGGGWPYQVAPDHPSIAFATSTFHFVEFDVEGPRIRIEGKHPDGQVFDTAEYIAKRHVRVEPVFPVRGEPCTISYDPRGGPLADTAQVNLHLGRDEFNHILMDLPMVREEGHSVWTATFIVPESPKWNLAFCFFNENKTVWHNNYSLNWQALLQREW